MKSFLWLIPFLFCVDLAAAAPQGSITQNHFVFSYARGERGASGHAGAYNIAAATRGDWFGLVREIPIGANFSIGAGFHFNGPEIELWTTRSPINVRDFELDLNQWLTARARIKFNDVMPYAQISYRYLGRQERLSLRVDGGLRLLRVAAADLELGGDIGVEVRARTDVYNALRNELFDGLEEYYIEPVISLNLRYQFG